MVFSNFGLLRSSHVPQLSLEHPDLILRRHQPVIQALLGPLFRRQRRTVLLLSDLYALQLQP
jgi:hypothetical protein